MNARSMTGAGFTIVETMIFLAISGLMFVLAISAMGGKQQQTEFQTGVDTLRSELNQQLSNVSDGNYPAIKSYTNCTVTVNTEIPIYSTSASQVTPDGSCDVIGEVIAFNTSAFTVLPVIGRNDQTNSADTALTEADPHIYTSEEQTVTMPFGLQITEYTNPPTNGVAIDGDNSGQYGSVGLFSFTSFDGNSSSNELSSGSEHVEIFAIPHTSLTNSPDNVKTLINSATTGLTNYGTDTDEVSVDNRQTTINPGGGIVFCVNSGTTSSQSALFTIGGVNSASTVTYQVMSQSGC